MVLSRLLWSYLNYELNVQKTQVISFNYNPSQVEKSVKYLGINILKELSRLAEVNYVAINKKIVADIHRWNLIPYLSLSSRTESIKMNVLPRVLHLFQSVLGIGQIIIQIHMGWEIT